jgi:hypothetical protein
LFHFFPIFFFLEKSQETLSFLHQTGNSEMQSILLLMVASLAAAQLSQGDIVNPNYKKKKKKKKKKGTPQTHADSNLYTQAFTSFNADEDGFAVVALTNLPSSINIFFTDRPVSGSGFDDSRAKDGVLTWTTSSIVAAGTVVRFSAVDTTPAVSTGAVALTDGTFNLSPNAETLIAYQGQSTSSTSLLAAVSTESVTPTGLTNGVNAVIITNSAEFGEYTGDRSSQSSFSAYAPIVNNAANWQIASVTTTMGPGGHEEEVPDTTAFTIVTSAAGDPHLVGANGITLTCLASQPPTTRCSWRRRLRSTCSSPTVGPRCAS